MKFNENANWIWLPEALDDQGRNLTACFRRSFTLDAVPESATLSISADSRFLLYVNGQQVGQGPARSWHFNKQYDTYEAAPYLRPGSNVVAVQVVRWGIACSFDVGGTPGGLLAQLSLEGRSTPLWVTDNTWKTTIHQGFKRQVPRHAYGMAYTEQFDANLFPEEWTCEGFDDADWPDAAGLGLVGMEPWVEMSERKIPLLLEQSTYPKSVMDVTAVRPPQKSLMLDLHDASREVQDDLSGPFEVPGILVGEFVTDTGGEVMMMRMNTSFNLDAFDAMRVNGKDVSFTQDRTTLKLNKGRNLVTLKFSPHFQDYPSWIFEGDETLRFKAPGQLDGPFASYLCPSLADESTVDEIWKASRDEDLGNVIDQLRVFREDEVLTDVFAIANARQELPAQTVNVEAPEAMCSENAELAILKMPAQGDLEFLLDFGEELVGFLEFEICSSAGAIIDFNCFEAVIDGKWVWTDNLNNTLRYTTRQGWQRFRSVVRRGFRYAQVTVRNTRNPVRIRSVRCIKNTYPVQELGAFECSDGSLTRYWEMGRRTTQLCMEDTFVDCPAYEQTFWVGDCRNESLAGYVAFGDTRLAERCLFLAADSLFRSPIPEQCVPSRDAWKNILPCWALFWVFACEEFYQYTGDRDFVKRIYPSVLKTCNSFIERIGEDGLMRFPGWNMLDWAAMDCLPGSATCHENGWLVKVLRKAASLADLVGADDGDQMRNTAEALVAAINRELWDDGMQAYADSIRPDGKRSEVFSQQSQTVVYLCDCVPEDRLARVVETMKDAPEGWVTIGTPFMAWFCLEALAKREDYTTMVDWYHKVWGPMAKEGATTCWEHVKGSSCDSFRWTPTRSWCHAWSAAPTYFLSTYQLGVNWLEAGCRRVVVAPQPEGLTWAKGRVPTPQGVVSVAWEIEQEMISVRVVVPRGVEASISVPEGLKPGSLEVIEQDRIYMAE